MRLRLPSALFFLMTVMMAPCAGGECETENLINVSWGDQIVEFTGDAQLDTADKIERSLVVWKRDSAGKTILWRAASYYVERFYERRYPREYLKRHHDIFMAALKEFDPLKKVRKETLKNGQTFLCYLTIYDHGAPVTEMYGGPTGFPFAFQDRFTIEHPQYQAVDRQGNYHYGVLEMAYPQSRELMVKRIRDFCEEFESDGVYVCTRTHSLPAKHADQFGFSGPVVKEYMQRYGIDILSDPRFDYANPAFDSHDPAVENWRKLRGEYLVRFFRELRRALPGKVIYAGIPRGRYLGPPYGNVYLDWEALVEEDLVDGLVLGVFSGKWIHSGVYVPHSKVGYLSSEDDAIAIPDIGECMTDVYGPLCRAHGTKLFFNSGNYGMTERTLKEKHDVLSGFMFNVPVAGSGKAEIPSDDRLSFPAGKMTIDAWVYVNGIEKSDRIISKYDHVLDNNARRGYEWQVGKDGLFIFRVNQILPNQSGRGTDSILKSTAKLPLKRWVHIATAFDPPRREMRLYINGRLDATITIPPHPIRMTPKQNVFIGRYGGMDMCNFDGMLDELRFTANALEFTKPPDRPYTGNEPDLLALYHLDHVNTGGFVSCDAGTLSRNMRLQSHSASPLSASKEGFQKALDMRRKPH